MADRIEASVLSLSWIPMGAVSGATKMPFETGVAHYDQPPPDVVASLDAIEELRASDRFRFCNRLAAYVEVENGAITGYGYEGSGFIGSTTLNLIGKGVTFQAVAFPDLQAEPEVGENFVRFLQTAGGRTGVPMPRTVKHPPFLQIAAPTAWSTLALTIFADGTIRHELMGASPFPRHWVYDYRGTLAEKTAKIDFKEWAGKAFGKHSPWGDEESPAITAAVESAFERELSTIIIDAKPEFRKVREGDTLVEQGETGDEIFLLFDGLLRVEKDGEGIAELGPGAILGEMAVIGDGTRMATVRAVTDCRVAVMPGSAVDRSKLEAIAKSRGSGDS